MKNYKDHLTVLRTLEGVLVYSMREEGGLR